MIRYITLIKYSFRIRAIMIVIKTKYFLYPTTHNRHSTSPTREHKAVDGRAFSTDPPPSSLTYSIHLSMNCSKTMNSSVLSIINLVEEMAHIITVSHPRRRTGIPCRNNSIILHYQSTHPTTITGGSLPYYFYNFKEYFFPGGSIRTFQNLNPPLWTRVKVFLIFRAYEPRSE